MPSIREAGPENIVPTSSTTTQLALGDAIAISCMRHKNFNKLDFKKFHPSGTLSIKLKTAGDLMLVKNKIPIINEAKNMNEALKLINSKRLGFLVIVNNQGLTTGVFTDGDLRRCIEKEVNLSTKIKNLSKSFPITIKSNEKVSKALEIMKKNKISILPVVDNFEFLIGSIKLSQCI